MITQILIIRKISFEGFEVTLEDSRTTVLVYLFYVARELIWRKRHMENSCRFKDHIYESRSSSFELR